MIVFKSFDGYPKEPLPVVFLKGNLNLVISVLARIPYFGVYLLMISSFIVLWYYDGLHDAALEEGSLVILIPM